VMRGKRPITKALLDDLDWSAIAASASGPEPRVGS
jgi:hypothetical protein